MVIRNVMCNPLSVMGGKKIWLFDVASLIEGDLRIPFHGSSFQGHRNYRIAKLSL